MNDPSELEQKIEQRLAVSNERRLAEQAAVRREMEEHEQRTGRFSAIARRLMHDIVRPRMLKLAGLFPNAHLSDVDESVGYGVVCELNHTPEYPASTELTIGVSADSAVEQAILTYNLQILPIFFKFDGHDQLAVPLSAFDDGAIIAWVDRKLLDFTDTYLQLQDIDQYQRENMVVDPVCGMRINRTIAAATTEHKGRTYYFCAEQCQQKFAEDPERYTAKSQ
jgi:YHS domain-containing protein